MPGAADQRSARRARLTGAACLLLAMAAPPGPAGAATGAVVTAAEPVPGAYIVTLAGRDKAAPAATARSLARRAGGRVSHVYTRALRGFAVTGIGEAEAARLAADPAVARVEQDAVVRATATEPGAPWGLDRIDQRAGPPDGAYAYAGAAQGAGVHAYVIDTGIRSSHQEFGGRASSAFDVVDGTGTDCDGHGTHVAATIGGATYGVAKQVTLHSVRVLNCEGTGSRAGVIAGVEWVTANHSSPAVANMSLGGESATGVRDALDQAVAASIAAGVTYTLAAGNANFDVESQSPAHVEEGITVAATDQGDRRADFSNFGPGVDVFAPGTGVLSAGIASDTASATLSGTSMAAPHAAGVAAKYLQVNPEARPADVAGVLLADAGTGSVTDPGQGTPNRLLHSPPDPAARGAVESVTPGSVHGWADDRSCPGPVTVRVTADPPGDRPPGQIAEVTADRAGPGRGPHRFKVTAPLEPGTVVTAAALGLGESCQADGSVEPLAGPGMVVAPLSVPDGPATFVPVGARAGTTTGIQILNGTDAPAGAAVRWIAPDGTVRGGEELEVPGGGASTLVDRAPAGFEGAAVVTALDGDRPLQTVVNHLAGGRAASSTAATAGDLRVHLPLLMRGHFGTTTRFAIQNTTRTATTADITYSYLVPAQAGWTSARETGLTIPPLATRIIDQSAAPGPPSETVFSATVEARAPVVVTVTEESAGSLLEYDGIPDSAAGTELFMPLVTANNFGTWTGVQLKNVGTDVATVQFTYGPNSAAAADPAMPKGRCAAPNGRQRTIPPGGTLNVLQRTGTAPEEDTHQFDRCTYLGSATVRADQPLVGIVNQTGPAGSSAYEAVPVARLGRTVRLPLVQVNNYGTIGGVQIADHDLATSPLTITFGPNIAPEPPAPGPGERPQPPRCTEPPTAGPVQLAFGETLTIVLPRDTPAIKDCTYIGSVEVTSAKPAAKLAALANQVTPAGADGLATYAVP